MWHKLTQWLGRSGGRRDPERVHMTWARSTIGRSVSRTRLVLKKQLWIWPIAAVAILSLVGYTVSRSIQSTLEGNVRSELLTLLSVERSMLEKWFRVQESSAVSLANDQQVRQTIAALLAAEAEADEARQNAAATPAEDRPAPPAGAAPPAAPVAAEAPLSRSAWSLVSELTRELEPGLATQGFVGYAVVDKRLRVVAADARELVGRSVDAYEPFVAPALEGRPTVSPPFASVVALKDALGRTETGTPTMFVCAPVRNDNFQVVAALALRIRPEKEFTEILQLGQLGETGETYAVDRQGLMVSGSRFDRDLILLGLLPDRDDAASILELEIRDPGGNLLEGHRPGIRRRELPLTLAAAAVTSGAAGVNLAGYRDYRGVPVVGAWTWLPAYSVGLVTEIDAAEAFRPLSILRRLFFALYALLGASALAIFVFTLVVARLERKARQATIEARQLGQYRLEERIGAGAMGVVYRGQHAMLRRPTAIKLLDVERVNEASIERFEREVQITCKLNNPHTVAIYDYGRTPEGVFYYAMEFLDGVNLQTLVEQYGPQPEGRVVRILKQICASLYEAHSLGLVHRDIKPANVMLNRRGAEPDVVKVLDFGLVKALDEERPRASEGQMSGTPLYMSPEAIQTPDLVDARSDLYAVGAVGYFLLTGQPPFGARSLAELCQQHVTAIPASPSERLGRPISPELEHALLACLEKSRAKRPQTARDLAAMLERVAGAWSFDEAEAWWSRHERGQHTGAASGEAPVRSPATGEWGGSQSGYSQQNRAQPTQLQRGDCGEGASPTGATRPDEARAGSEPASRTADRDADETATRVSSTELEQTIVFDGRHETGS